MPGFVVLGVEETNGELEVKVETTGSRTGCPRCGVIAALHDRRVTGYDTSTRSTGRCGCGGASGCGAAMSRCAHRSPGRRRHESASRSVATVPEAPVRDAGLGCGYPRMPPAEVGRGPRPR